MNSEDKNKISKRWITTAAVVILAIGVVAFGLFQERKEVESRTKLSDSPAVEPVLNARAPDFKLQTVSGETVSLSELRGQPVLINFWATWCGPCRIEMPAIQDRYEIYKADGLVVLAVNFDEAQDDVKAYGEELGLTFPLVLDPGGEIQRLYRNRSYPTSFFVDEQGIIRAHHIGVLTEGQLDDNLAKIGLGE